MIEYLNCCMLFLICAAEVNVLCEGSPRFSYKYDSYIYLVVKMIISNNLASRSAGAQSETVKSTGCGFDPHSRK